MVLRCKECGAKAEAAVQMVRFIFVYNWQSTDANQSSVQTQAKNPPMPAPDNEAGRDHCSWKLCTFPGGFLACIYLPKYNFGALLIFQI